MTPGSYFTGMEILTSLSEDDISSLSLWKNDINVGGVKQSEMICWHTNRNYDFNTHEDNKNPHTNSPCSCQIDLDFSLYVFRVCLKPDFEILLLEHDNIRARTNL